MLEILTYRAYKKHKLSKELREKNAKEALDPQDEAFIRSSLDHNIATPPPMKRTIKKFPATLRTSKKKEKSPAPVEKPVVDEIPTPTPTEEELEAIHDSKDGTETPNTQEQELSEVLETLNLAISSKHAFSLSDETKALLKQFLQILKDIQSGAPHAYQDLTTFLSSSNEHLNSLFDKTPPFIKTLITALPFPMARKLDHLDTKKKSAKDITMDILKELVKPGVVTGLLKNIMNVLRTRFPAFVGTNALLSLGVFVLLFGLWYCYKRGKEERMKLAVKDGENAEILVEGTTAQDGVDHGVGTALPLQEQIRMETSPREEVDETPLQMESEPIPPVVKRKGFFSRK